MSQQVYSWKRFWCHRLSKINVFDGGYLYDIDTEWGKAYNPDLATLEAIASAGMDWEKRPHINFILIDFIYRHSQIPK